MTFKATVAGITPTGTVTFKDGANPIAWCWTSAGPWRRQRILRHQCLAIGTHSITAGYWGDSRNGAASSTP